MKAEAIQSATETPAQPWVRRPSACSSLFTIAHLACVVLLWLFCAACAGLICAGLVWPSGPLSGRRLGNFDNSRIDRLAFAIESQDEAQVRRLLARLSKQDLQATDEGGRTLLLRAASLGRGDLCRQLIERGADVRAVDAWGCEILWFAINSQCAATIEVVLSAGADVHWRHDPSGLGPLAVAASRHSAPVLRAVLATGIEVDQRDRWQRTPLMYAATVDSADGPEMVAMLLEAGADPNATDELGETPLTLAAGEGPPESVRLLLKAGANPLHANASGMTAVDRARLNLEEQVLSLLADGSPTKPSECNDRTAEIGGGAYADREAEGRLR